MSEMRESTDNLRIGIGKIRWGDSEVEVKRRYPHHRLSNRLQGRSPTTGELVEIAPGLVIDDFDRIENAIRLVALVDFDRSGVVSIRLDSEPAQPVSDPDRWPDIVSSAAVALGQRLGFGPVDPRTMEQRWRVGGVAVSLFLEHSEFGVVFEPRG